MKKRTKADLQNILEEKQGAIYNLQQSINTEMQDIINNVDNVEYCKVKVLGLNHDIYELFEYGTEFIDICELMYW